MRIYLADPMRGYPEHNFPAFNAAAAGLRDAGHTVFNPADTGEPTGWSIRDFLFVDLAWICNHAEAIALLPGWEKSKGATAEHATALAIGIPVIFLETGESTCSTRPTPSAG